MRSVTACLWVTVLLSAVAFGQVPADEARRRLAEKQAARQAAVTQPAPVSGSEVEALRAELVRLTRERDLLAAEVAKLAAEVKRLQGSPASRPAFVSVEIEKTLKPGMTQAEAEAALEALSDALKQRRKPANVNPNDPGRFAKQIKSQGTRSTRIYYQWSWGPSVDANVTYVDGKIENVSFPE